MGTLWEKLIRPAAFALDAERAHEMGIEAMRLGIVSLMARRPDHHAEFGRVERFGLKFSNPLGMAAGFDKNGVVVDQLAGLGFGFVEVGTVTYDPQPGNPKPRLFRLPQDQALINRLGFNNDGAVAIAERLSNIDRRCVIGVNIGRNKAVPNDEATENYLKSFDIVHEVADYVAVNISSPNTPDLRQLQRSESLTALLDALQKRNRELGTKPLLVKIAPDLSESDIEAIVDICQRFEISGIIATNTTIARDDLLSEGVSKLGPGGLSGRPLNRRSTQVISTIHKYSNGKLPIIGVGGVFSAADAFEKIAAGACLIQAYTGFVYGGPTFPGDTLDGLAGILSDRGFSTVDEAVGSADPH